jgi:hypothetical protein
MTDGVAVTPAPLLSFPAILRNSALKDRFAHLHELSPSSDGTTPNQVPLKIVRTDQHGGKRWARRKDNGLSSIVSRTQENMTNAYCSALRRQSSRRCCNQEGLYLTDSLEQGHIPRTAPSLPSQDCKSTRCYPTHSGSCIC